MAKSKPEGNNKNKSEGNKKPQTEKPETTEGSETERPDTGSPSWLDKPGESDYFTKSEDQGGEKRERKDKK